MAKKVGGSTARATKQESCPKPPGKQAIAVRVTVETHQETAELTIDIEAGYDAICETAQCPCPELARGVTAYAARRATNGHSKLYRGHVARVIARQ